MILRRVFLAPRAEADLDNLALWIAEQGVPLTAFEYVARVRRFLSSLDQFPDRGANYGHVRAGLRVVSFEKRVVIAIVVRDEHVEVERVFSGG
jgi:plasmid stabilization system protein ParE